MQRAFERIDDERFPLAQEFVHCIARQAQARCFHAIIVSTTSINPLLHSGISTNTTDDNRQSHRHGFEQQHSRSSLFIFILACWIRHHSMGKSNHHHFTQFINHSFSSRNFIPAWRDHHTHDYPSFRFPDPHYEPSSVYYHPESAMDAYTASSFNRLSILHTSSVFIIPTITIFFFYSFQSTSCSI